MIGRITTSIDVRWTDDRTAGRVVIHRTRSHPLTPAEVDGLLEVLGAERVSG